ncbi:MAG: hypothetical protein IKE58_06385 [Blautia sp.]|nr:hypothetical protein [Blautia sp.]
MRRVMMMALACAAASLLSVSAWATDDVAGALSLMEPAIHAYAESSGYGEVDLSSQDVDRFWSMIRMFGIFRDQYDYAHGIANVREFFYSDEDVREIAYCLFDDFAGNVPPFYVDPMHGRDIVDGLYHLEPATPQQQQFELLSYRWNDDNSVDAAYALKYKEYRDGSMDYYERSRHYVHLVPNEHANYASPHPLFFRIQAMSGEETGGSPDSVEDGTESEEIQRIEIGDTIGQDINEVGSAFGGMMSQVITSAGVLTPPDEMEDKVRRMLIQGLTVTLDDDGIITRIDLQEARSHSIKGIYVGMPVGEAIETLHARGYTLEEAGSTKGVLAVWGGYTDGATRLSFVTDQHAPHGSVTSESEMDKAAHIESITLAWSEGEDAAGGDHSSAGHSFIGHWTGYDVDGRYDIEFRDDGTLTITYGENTASRYWYVAQSMEDLLTGDVPTDQKEGTIICHEGSPAVIQTLTFEWQDEDHLLLNGALFSRNK